jgi:hypothetical protein
MAACARLRWSKHGSVCAVTPRQGMMWLIRSRPREVKVMAALSELPMIGGVFGCREHLLSLHRNVRLIRKSALRLTAVQNGRPRMISSLIAKIAPKPSRSVILVEILSATLLFVGSDASAEAVYSVRVQAGWRAEISFSPPAGWVRQQGPDAVWYVAQGIPAGACSIILPPPENFPAVDSITAFRAWHKSSVKSGQILHQTDLAWGTSTCQVIQRGECKVQS